MCFGVLVVRAAGYWWVGGLGLLVLVLCRLWHIHFGGCGCGLLSILGCGADFCGFVRVLVVVLTVRWFCGLLLLLF